MVTRRSFRALRLRSTQLSGSRRWAIVAAAGGGLPVAHGGQGAGEFGVDLLAVFDGEAGGFPDDQGGAVFADLPGAQRVVGVRHFPDQGLRGADVPVAAGGGVVPGEGDLGVDAAVGSGVPLLSLGESGGLRGDEGQGERGLGGGAGGFDAFEFGDLVDQFGVGGVVVDVAELVDQVRQVGGGQHRVSDPGDLRADPTCVRLYPAGLGCSKSRVKYLGTRSPDL